jgi:hypothetical protein
MAVLSFIAASSISLSKPVRLLACGRARADSQPIGAHGMAVWFRATARTQEEAMAFVPSDLRPITRKIWAYRHECV